ncbi:sodium-dependent transporter [Chitinivibrio alkaliphilus]|uniref:SNF family Na+-dependent transporter n=1 Tax=Chitinivibrio alkaliphilus ACht1 TaxID=1313304 RepID=U7D876_9BACT|nr:sodium-dependent transporter [Chitinivibrio alkaliphilus]ERP32143.1 SNF family Na+-dependent transporter [Chitinivibrio alkaliphilus ACht1]
MNREREKWGSKIGVILAVAGSAVGLGNFLVFPGRVVENGGGAFMIPYFIAFILIGIPLAWIEWSMGRWGGRQGHGSGPGILNAVTQKPYAKYLGSIGVMGPLLIFFLYVYLESWILAYIWYSLTGVLSEAAQNNTTGELFSRFISHEKSIGPIPASLFFFGLTFLINFAVIYFGIRRGIEKTVKVLMPLLLFLGIALVLKVLTLENLSEGLAFMWNPDFSKLRDTKVWFDATSQVFFTTSVGIGAILTYASYVRKDQDIALSSLTANSTNVFIEVIVGGTIVIVPAVICLGAIQAQEVTTGGIFSLGFITMPMLFQEMGPTVSWVVQLTWFVLLFIGGVTSSISILQPGLSFIEDELNLQRKKAISLLGVITLFFSLLIIAGGDTAINEADILGFQLALLVFGAVEAVLFAWVLGGKKGWQEIQKGADIGIPQIYRHIITWITPTFILVLLFFWAYDGGMEHLLMRTIDQTSTIELLGGFEMKEGHFILLLRGLFIALFAGINGAIFYAFQRKDA